MITEKEKSRAEHHPRREHCLNVYISYELRERIRALAEKYDRTSADIVRSMLKVAVPLMEGMSQSEAMMVEEYVKLFKRLRQVKALKDI